MYEIRGNIRKIINKVWVTLRGVKTSKVISEKTTIEEPIQGMIDSGSVEWNGEKLPPYRIKIINHSKGFLSDLIVEDRE